MGSLSQVLHWLQRLRQHHQATTDLQALFCSGSWVVCVCLGAESFFPFHLRTLDSRPGRLQSSLGAELTWLGQQAAVVLQQFWLCARSAET